jgi:hypothetical protein
MLVDGPYRNGEQTALKPASPEREQRFAGSPRTQAALHLLLEAYEYAHELSRNVWDFAVEIGGLRQEGITVSGFRWLVCKGFVEHAREITPPGGEDRAFERQAGLNFSKKTCFVLTEAGFQFAQSAMAQAAPFIAPLGSDPFHRSTGPSESLVPTWDRDRQELRLGNLIVKQFKVPAPNQEVILAAFQEEHWPVRIDDPLPPHPEQDPKRRLHDTINALNRNQKHALLRFLGDGSGQGVRWDLVRPPQLVPTANGRFSQ